MGQGLAGRDLAAKHPVKILGLVVVEAGGHVLHLGVRGGDAVIEGELRAGEAVTAITYRAMRGELDFEGALRERVARMEWKVASHPLPIVPAVLGDKAGACGAARQALLQSSSLSHE